MKFAAYRDTGEHVSADEISVDNMNYQPNLICPCCGELVHYVRESRNHKSSHFAHNTGKGTETCDNYHPSYDSYQNSHDNDGVINTKKDTIALTLNIVTSHFFTWNLEIAVTSTIEGDAICSQGLQGEVRVPLGKVKSIPVLIQAEDYQVKIVTSCFERMEIINALGLKRVNIFINQHNQRGRLDKFGPLRWGDSYFLVWHKDYQLDLELLEIERYALNTLDHWQCVEINLPDREDPKIASWITKYLHREIKRPPPRLRLVMPIGANSIVAFQDEVIIGINYFQQIVGTLKITYPNHVKQSLNMNSSSMVNIGYLPVGQTTILFESNDDHDKLILNCVSSQPIELPQSAIYLNFPDKYLPVHSLKFNSINLDSDPKKLEFPALLSFFMLFGENEHIKQRIEIKPALEEALSNFQERALQNIIEQSAQGTCQLDFGNFGQLMLGKQVIFFESRLTDEIRKKLCWLNNLSCIYGIKLFPKMPLTLAELNECLHNINRNYLPTGLEVYLRALEKQIKK